MGGGPDNAYFQDRERLSDHRCAASASDLSGSSGGCAGTVPASLQEARNPPQSSISSLRLLALGIDVVAVAVVLTLAGLGRERLGDLRPLARRLHAGGRSGHSGHRSLLGTLDRGAGRLPGAGLRRRHRGVPPRRERIPAHSRSDRHRVLPAPVRSLPRLLRPGPRPRPDRPVPRPGCPSPGPPASASPWLAVTEGPDRGYGRPRRRGRRGPQARVLAGVRRRRCPDAGGAPRTSLRRRGTPVLGTASEVAATAHEAEADVVFFAGWSCRLRGAASPDCLGARALGLPGGGGAESHRRFARARAGAAGRRAAAAAPGEAAHRGCRSQGEADLRHHRLVHPARAALAGHPVRRGPGLAARPGPGLLQATAHRAQRGDLRLLEVPDDGHRCRVTAGSAPRRARCGTGDLRQDQGRSPDHSPRSLAASPLARRAAPAAERAPRRHEPRRTAAAGRP